MRMKSVLTFVFLSFCYMAFGQVSYNANTQVQPYTGVFRQGINFDYYPPYNDINLSDIAAGNPALGLSGIGATTSRPALFESFVEAWGYDSRVYTFQHMKNLGMKDMTCIVGYPSEAHRDHTVYCSNGTTQSAMFANLYTPIWDGGENGTPYNDDNYLAAYLYKTVTLYKNNVKFWEIWNEPGFDLTWNTGWRPPGDAAGNWWDEDPDPCDYVLHAPIEHFIRTLRISYEVIKTVDPDAYVVLAGVGYESFLDAILRNTDNPDGGTPSLNYPNKGGAYFDVMGFHTYPDLDGSLGHFDSDLNDWVRYRHSDAAVDGMTNRKNNYQALLSQYGYDGTTYPKKEWVITENNTPRVAFSPTTMASDESQVNYIMKSVVTAMQLDIRQMHPYQLSDRTTIEAADDEYDLMGMYLNITGTTPYENLQKTNEGIAYKTSSDALSGTTYDPIKTAEMNLPDTIGGGAFQDPVNDRYVYCLWVKTSKDLDETANGSYSFPASFGYNSLILCEWDKSETGESPDISATEIPLSGRPIYLFDGEEIDYGLLTLACPDTVHAVIPAGSTSVSASWDVAITSTTCPSSTDVELTVDAASGSDFTVGPHRVTYYAMDNCQNEKECSFTVAVEAEEPGEISIDCPSNITIAAPEGSNQSIVIWDDATASTTCLTNEAIVTQTGGQYSGATFVIGGHTIGYHATDLCGNETSCQFLITVQAAAGTCPNAILAFTKMGEVDEHGYYLSQNTMNWETASTLAQTSGGYLVTIGSQDENDYIKNQIDDAVFIGLNDAMTEGSLVWSNGALVDYTNYNTNCDWCNTNDAVNDYVEMVPWDGSWIFDGQWAQRKFVMEMNCSEPSQIIFECPANIAVVSGSGQEVVSWIEPTGTTSCTTNDQITVSQLSGQESGAIFTLGTHLISYNATDDCENSVTCSFTVAISQDASECLTVPGYTKLGDYENHGYYISDDMANWESAKLLAENVGGHLVTINDADENDFIHTVLGLEMAFIGYEDATTEGDGQWANGETSSIDLSYDNDMENDYAIINFWAGTWQLVNGQVEKKYIVEMPCTSGPTDMCGEKSGFDFIGKYEGNGYYLSEQNNSWQLANDIAYSHQGNLASIQSQAENDFIQAGLGNVMPFIGYNDVATEGDVIWTSGESVDFDLSFDNTEDHDVAVMAFWDGSWQMVNSGVYKKFVMEIGCQETTSQVNNDQLVLTLSQNKFVAKLSWENQFNNTDYFIIERSNGSANFVPIAQVDNDMANRSGSFQYRDVEPLVGLNVYRITAISLTGKKKSNLQYGHFSERNSITLYPNPAAKFVILDLLPYKGQQATIEFSNQYGQLVKSLVIDKVAADPERIELDGFRNGFYQITIRTENGQSTTQKLIVTQGY